MQTLNIEIPEGYVIDNFDLSSGKVTFKPKPKKVTERIGSLKDAIAALGSDDEEVVAYHALLELLDNDHHLVSQQAVIVITKALNEGWVPNWSNSNEVKYAIWFEMRGSSGFRFHDYDSWTSTSDVGSRLCFKSRELAEYAGKKFQDLYENFMTIKP